MRLGNRRDNLSNFLRTYGGRGECLFGFWHKFTFFLVLGGEREICSWEVPMGTGLKIDKTRGGLPGTWGNDSEKTGGCDG